MVDAVRRTATIEALASLASRPLDERDIAINAAPIKRQFIAVEKKIAV